MSMFAPFGLNIATGAFALRTFAAAPVPAHFARRYMGISFQEIAGPQVRVFFASAMMGLGVVVLRVALTPFVAQRYLLFILVLAGVCLYAGLVVRLQPDMMEQFTRRFTRRLKETQDLSNRI
ncbi:MAG: hypothetical protein WDM77_04385 [Steroidobacteraceae bacterium]